MINSLENIYISPLELCNLRCLYCYTDKTKSILSNEQILHFINEYKSVLANLPKHFLEPSSKHQPLTTRKNIFESLPTLKSIIFCGGEVFTLKDFPALLNQVVSKGIFVSVITNGVVDRLNEIVQPHNCQLIVSFDGPEKIHDQNRGSGNYQKSKAFVQKALNLGFPVEIFYLITKDSFPYKDSFPREFRSSLKFPASSISFTFLTDRLGSLTKVQEKNIRTNYPCYPPKNFGCNIFSLQSNGKFYGCCESNKSIGNLSDPLEPTVFKYLDIITRHPKCSDPDYWCGLK